MHAAPISVALGSFQASPIYLVPKFTKRPWASLFLGQPTFPHLVVVRGLFKKKGVGRQSTCTTRSSAAGVGWGVKKHEIVHNVLPSISFQGPTWLGLIDDPRAPPQSRCLLPPGSGLSVVGRRHARESRGGGGGRARPPSWLAGPSSPPLAAAAAEARQGATGTAWPDRWELGGGGA